MMIQFSCTEIENFPRMLSFNVVCSLIAKWGSTIGYVTIPEMEFLNISCSVSDNKDDRQPMFVKAACDVLSY
jgi:hypothetical protein